MHLILIYKPIKLLLVPLMQIVQHVTSLTIVAARLMNAPRQLKYVQFVTPTIYCKATIKHVISKL